MDVVENGYQISIPLLHLRFSSLFPSGPFQSSGM